MLLMLILFIPNINSESRLMKRLLCVFVDALNFKDDASGFLGKTLVASTQTVALILKRCSTPASRLSSLAGKKKKKKKNEKGKACSVRLGFRD